MNHDDVFDLDAARQARKSEYPFSTNDYSDSKAREKKQRVRSSLLIPETLDGEVMEKFLVAIAKKYPRRTKKALRAIQWLDDEGKKAGIW